MSDQDRDVEKANELPFTPIAQTPSLREQTLEYEKTNYPNLQPVCPYPTKTQTSTSSPPPTSPLDSNSDDNDDSQETLTAANTRASEHHPDYLTRLATHRSQYLGTVGSSACARNEKRQPFGNGKEYPPQLPGRDLYVVEFDGKDDPLHGMNWALGRK